MSVARGMVKYKINPWREILCDYLESSGRVLCIIGLLLGKTEHTVKELFICKCGYVFMIIEKAV